MLELLFVPIHTRQKSRQTTKSVPLPKVSATLHCLNFAPSLRRNCRSCLCLVWWVSSYSTISICNNISEEQTPAKLQPNNNAWKNLPTSEKLFESLKFYFIIKKRVIGSIFIEKSKNTQLCNFRVELNHFRKLLHNSLLKLFTFCISVDGFQITFDVIDHWKQKYVYYDCILQ